MLNGHEHSPWADVKAGVPLRLIHGPLLFLIDIKDLPNVLNLNAKHFADDTPLFPVVHNITDSTSLLNTNLSKMGTTMENEF